VPADHHAAPAPPAAAAKLDARLPPWLAVTELGLWCEPGRFHIDPHEGVARAVITHGHSDHARSGHASVLATSATADIIRARLGDDIGSVQPVPYGERLRIGDVSVSFLPAGHILGSAQVLLEYRGCRAVVSGDFKRRRDPTCAPFVPVPCDVFITEATFGLPVFRHPVDAVEIDRLLASLRLFPERCHLVGVYALGKCQRVIALLREAGYDRPVFLHGALAALCNLYERHGVFLGPLAPASGDRRRELAGEIVLCPPSALADRWARAFPDPVVAMASGWMRVRQRARQRGIELPLVISDHADWLELTRTIEEVAAPVVLVTHGREEGLVHYAETRGFASAALSLSGYDEDSA
jgi:putative mRNA 3-end processing factor